VRKKGMRWGHVRKLPYSLPDLVLKGSDLEKVILSGEVGGHLDHRVLSYANKIVVFD
jgi:formyltetrahydrofolate hydrolase